MIVMRPSVFPRLQERIAKNELDKLLDCPFHHMMESALENTLLFSFRSLKEIQEDRRPCIKRFFTQRRASCALSGWCKGRPGTHADGLDKYYAKLPNSGTDLR